jgi:hypothetical protein
MRRIVRVLLLVAPLYAASLVAFPSATPQAWAKAKKAKKPKKEAAPEIGADGLPSGDAPASSAKVHKVSAAAIVKWSKKGLPDAEILARAQTAGYVASKKDLRMLKKKRVSSDLIAALGGSSAPIARAEPKKESPREEPVAAKAEPKVDLTKPARVKDIDFDDVPPPPGSSEAAAAQSTPKKEAPPLDRSARPSSPTEETSGAPTPAQPAAAPRIRKPIVATD